MQGINALFFLFPVFLSQLPVGWTHPKSRGQGKALFLRPLLGQVKSGRGLKGQMAKDLT